MGHWPLVGQLISAANNQQMASMEYGIWYLCPRAVHTELLLVNRTGTAPWNGTHSTGPGCRRCSTRPTFTSTPRAVLTIADCVIISCH
jgi:hypothetical protein